MQVAAQQIDFINVPSVPASLRTAAEACPVQHLVLDLEDVEVVEGGHEFKGGSSDLMDVEISHREMCDRNLEQGFSRIILVKVGNFEK